MPRPRKNRRICGGLPQFSNFAPRGRHGRDNPILMSIDEYEAIRLIDHEGLLQGEAAERMNVARTTAQAIYNKARFKLATCLVEGRELIIEGGDIEICTKEGSCPNPNRGWRGRGNGCGLGCQRGKERNH